MRAIVAGNLNVIGLAASLAETVALKEPAGGTACDIAVRPPFTLIERTVKAFAA
ncbi:hypothetical protein [Neorhizobium alkalisoli]|uniref:hypothetical protein n=1 Tax=Neorhizobium alkalisoli TaxID=528178 RepID=UPI00131A2947|nr:hypothetical protein [Neorhizobium alkalisoli]